jgi:hypothetical protein
MVVDEVMLHRVEENSCPSEGEDVGEDVGEYHAGSNVASEGEDVGEMAVEEYVGVG